jgi:3-hydroxybutyryl-CoA dehydrogenase
MVNIKSVGVIGAGQMGTGIAHVAALAGYDVLLNDLTREKIDAGVAIIEHNMHRQVARGMISEADMKAALGRIRPAQFLEQIGPTDIAIEAATEDEETKKTIFRALHGHLGPDTLLASNTSSISITRLASVTDRPERFIGLHFMNPVPIMKLVEIIRGQETSDETTARIVAASESIEKVPVAANDFPGFVSNRVLMPMINEAVFCLMEGVSTREGIDTVMKLGMAHPMGPLALADLIGLDVCLDIMEVMHSGLGDDKYRPCPLLRRYVAAGRLGKKSGRGFYEYT